MQTIKLLKKIIVIVKIIYKLTAFVSKSLFKFQNCKHLRNCIYLTGKWRVKAIVITRIFSFTDYEFEDYFFDGSSCTDFGTR